jgi:PilZ domain
MSNQDRTQEGNRTAAPEVRKEGVASLSNETAAPAMEAKKLGNRYAEMQSAVRFPIRLPASVKLATGERMVETQNISANGVLLQMDTTMPIGSAVDFTIALPADVVGAESNVVLDCRGRVVRNYDEDGLHGVGVVIDEYRFERH